MIDTLSLGGGVVHIKEQFDTGSYEDIGYSVDLEIGMDIVQKFFNQYYTDSDGRLIRLPSTKGVITSASFNGAFVCESMTRNMLQKIWWLGDDTDAGTEPLYSSDLTPVVRALKFVPDVYDGPAVCVEFPAIELSISSKFLLISDSWKSLTFQFRALFDEDVRTFPIMRVQQPGESLVDFCI